MSSPVDKLRSLITLRNAGLGAAGLGLANAGYNSGYKALEVPYVTDVLPRLSKQLKDLKSLKDSDISNYLKSLSSSLKSDPNQYTHIESPLKPWDINPDNFSPEAIYFYNKAIKKSKNIADITSIFDKTRQMGLVDSLNPLTLKGVNSLGFSNKEIHSALGPHLKMDPKVTKMLEHLSYNGGNLGYENKALANVAKAFENSNSEMSALLNSSPLATSTGVFSGSGLTLDPSFIKINSYNPGLVKLANSVYDSQVRKALKDNKGALALLGAAYPAGYVAGGLNSQAKYEALAKNIESSIGEATRANAIPLEEIKDATATLDSAYSNLTNRASKEVQEAFLKSKDLSGNTFFDFGASNMALRNPDMHGNLPSIFNSSSLTNPMSLSSGYLGRSSGIGNSLGMIEGRMRGLPNIDDIKLELSGIKKSIGSLGGGFGKGTPINPTYDININDNLVKFLAEGEYGHPGGPLNKLLADFNVPEMTEYETAKALSKAEKAKALISTLSDDLSHVLKPGTLVSALR